MHIDLWFPSVIGKSDCPFFDEVKDSYRKRISSDEVKVVSTGRLTTPKFEYNSAGFCAQRVHEEGEFKRLNDWIITQVQEYADTHKFPGVYYCKDSWIVDYPVNSAQFFRSHPGSIISGIFFIEGQEDDVPVLFKNPVTDMKNALGHTVYENKAHLVNELTYNQVAYPPKTGQLLLWRSHLESGCNMKTLACKRTAFVYNFDVKVTLKSV